MFLWPIYAIDMYDCKIQRYEFNWLRSKLYPVNGKKIYTRLKNYYHKRKLKPLAIKKIHKYNNPDLHIR